LWFERKTVYLRRVKQPSVRLISAAMLALSLAAWPKTALAEETAKAPATKPPVLTPPELLRGDPIAYPESGSAGEKLDSSVIVALVVTTEGAVADPEIVSGAEPFATAALNGVRKYTFKPATRNGSAIPARIRLAVTFEAPPPQALPKNEEVVTAPGAPPAVAVEIEDVRVRGERFETQSPTETRLGRADVRVLPGAFGDPFRAIEILPGVVPIISGLPYFYVRGAPPSSVGYYVDEVRVPYLFHFGLGPGVIHPALIQEVALHPAAFPARFGRFSGGIVAGETREPSPELRGEGTIRLIDAGAFVEAPLLKGKAHIGLGGRFSYTAALLSLFLPEATIAYRDYNARFTYDLNERLRFTAFMFGAFDYASQIKTEDGVKKEEVLFASEFHRLDLRLDHTGEGRTHSRLAATIGLDRTRISGSRFARDYPIGLRGRHRQELGKGTELEVGADVLLDLYGGDVPSPYAVSKSEYASASTLYAGRTESASGAWVSLLFSPRKNLDITATMRADLFTSAGKLAFGPSPRLSMRVPLGALGEVPFTALFATGIAPQTPAFAIPLPAVGYSGIPGGLAYAFQKSAGVEVALPLKFTAKAVGFHHTYLNQRDIFAGGGDLEFDGAGPSSSPKGQAYGLEVYLARKFQERVSLTVSYTLNRSELASLPARPSTVTLFDRTHVFQAASSLDLGRTWLLGVRSVVYSGWPKRSAEVPVEGRLPTYFRFDARLEKKWSWRKTGYLSFILEGLNVTGSKEVLSQSCNPKTGECKNQDFGPLVVPSIGVEGSL
jgi:TonB family protein